MMRRPRLSRRSRRAIALVAGAATAVVTWRVAAGSGHAPHAYRTAVATRNAVQQTITRAGTLEPVAQASVAFPVAGTVATVDVQPGQAVTAGQQLATLDASSLQAQVMSAQASLAAAQLTLSKALAGAGASPTSSAATVSTASARTGPPSASGARPATASTAPSAPGSQSDEDVAALQQQADDAVAVAAGDFQLATAACQTPSTDSSLPATSASTTSTTTPDDAPCASALASALAAEQDASTAQAELAKAETAAAGRVATSSTGPTPSSTTTTVPAAPAVHTTTSPAVTPDQLVADQAAVDAANAAVAAAQQNVDQATIVSPITGTVAAVTLQPGEHVSAAAPTASIVVIGPGGYEVATTIGVGDVPMVHLGDSAVVVPDGDGRSLDGKVVAIGASPSTTGTTPTYPVVVGLVGDDGPLGNGASATVTITEAHASDALTVPTSAVHAVGAGALHVVTVLTASGETKTTPVLTGAVGTASTEILSGLSAGDKVVLADLSQAVPTANSSTTPRGLGGLGLGGTGGGLGGGGFGGGRAVAGR